MKLLHIADLHIGKTVNDFNMIEDQEYILNQLLDIIREQKIDAVLIAGGCLWQIHSKRRSSKIIILKKEMSDGQYELIRKEDFMGKKSKEYLQIWAGFRWMLFLWTKGLERSARNPWKVRWIFWFICLTPVNWLELSATAKS